MSEIHQRVETRRSFHGHPGIALVRGKRAFIVGEHIGYFESGGTQCRGGLFDDALRRGAGGTFVHHGTTVAIDGAGFLLSFANIFDRDFTAIIAFFSQLSMRQPGNFLSHLES